MALKKVLPTTKEDTKKTLTTTKENPKVVKTKINNPDGTITYRTDIYSKTPGSSSSKKRTPVNKIPVNKTNTTNRTTNNSSSSTSKTSPKNNFERREDIYIPGTKIVPILKPEKEEIGRPLPVSLYERKKLKEDIINRRQNKINTDWLESNRGKTLEDKAREDERYVKKQTRKAQRNSNDNTNTGFRGMFRTKKAVNPCKNC